MGVNTVHRMRTRIEEHMDMNADVKTNILSIALETKQLELERARMQLEDQQARMKEQQAKIEQANIDLTEEVSYIQAQLHDVRNFSETYRQMYDAASTALKIIITNTGNFDKSPHS